MSRKIASNDKILESITNSMDNFTSDIKNQLSFNKMIESQISQLAASVPMAKKGKILGNLDELETANLVGIFNVGEYFIAPPRPLRPVWGEEDMPKKKGDLGRLLTVVNHQNYMSTKEKKGDKN